MDWLTDYIEQLLRRFIKPKPEVRYLSGKGKLGPKG